MRLGHAVVVGSCVVSRSLLPRGVAEMLRLDRVIGAFARGTRHRGRDAAQFVDV